MKTDSPVLYYKQKRMRGDSLYTQIRREIFARTGQMPHVVQDEPDIGEFFQNNPDSELYIPVFIESKGWWGGLLGSDDIKVCDKIIISADCHLMIIKKSNHQSPITNHLFTAEIHPSSGFFQKMNTSIATSMDMLATDAGTILALFSGRNEKKFKTIVATTGNHYLGCIGGY